MEDFIKKLIPYITVLLILSLLLSGCENNASNNGQALDKNEGGIVNNKEDSISEENNNDASEENNDDNEVVDNTPAKKTTMSIWDGTIATDFGGGNGSWVNPYLIKNASQLAYLSECCKNGQTFLGETIKLECDINLNGQEWYPIGQYMAGVGDFIDSKAFRGTFDGAGHVISNFKISNDVINDDDPDLDLGLFGYVNCAYIHDLTVRNFSICDNGHWPYVGGMIGRAWENCFIDNCHVQNGFISVQGADNTVGGLIGEVKGSKDYSVSNCSADVDIIVECSVYNDYTYINEEGKECYYSRLDFLVGGLIGKAEGVNVYNCFSTGEASGSMITNAMNFTGDFIGGLIGYTSDSDVYSSYSTATVITENTQDEGYIGGLIGLAGGKVKQSYSSGRIECSSPSFYCGGLVGGTYDSIINCFSSTDIYAEGKNIRCNTLIGVIEKINGVDVTNCFISQDAVISNPQSSSSIVNQGETKVRSSDFLKKDFFSDTIDFIAYDKSKIEEDEYFSGWVFTDNHLPKLFFENDISINPVKLDQDISKYLGMTVSDLIKNLGYDYQSTSGNIISYEGAKTSFIIGEYPEMLTGKEVITGLVFRGNRDIGNGIKASMTFTELKQKFGEVIEEPVQLEIDQTYTTSVITGNLRYSFVWYDDSYNSEPCSYVSIYKVE